MNDWVRKNLAGWASYSLAIVLGLLFSCYLFSWNFLQGHVAFFEQGDPGQGVTAWLFYEQDNWRLPLTYTQRLNYPQGVSIALTDSIPLAAMFFKIFRNWLPDGFHYFGWWHLLSYLLQSISAVLLIRVLGYRSLLAAVVAAGFALLMPVFTWRYGHTALLTQGLILLAFSAYFLGLKEQTSLLKSSMIFILIALIALLIHPYLFAMTYPIFLAFLFDWGWQQKKWLSCLLAFLASTIVLSLSFYIFGYLDIHGANGFNLFAMNLLSPLCGGKFSIPCFYTKNDHFESFNYLGLGLILILLTGMLTQGKWLLQIPRRFTGLFVIILLFFLISLSNVFYFGDQKVFTLKLSPEILNLAAVFRSSGRFFWPVAYALLFVGLLGMLRWQKQNLAVGILLGCCLLQLLDTSFLLKNQKLDISKSDKYDFEKWDNLFAHLQTIDFVPEMPQYDEHKMPRYKDLILLAGRKKLLCNTAEFAHPASSSYHSPQDFTPQKDHLYIIMPDVAAAQIPKSLAELVQQGQCRNFFLADQSIATACIPGKKHQWWQTNAPFMWKIKS